MSPHDEGAVVAWSYGILKIVFKNIDLTFYDIPTVSVIK